MSENTLDRKELKIMAYKERLNEALEQNADLRVELTVVSNQLGQAYARIEELETPTQTEEDPQIVEAVDVSEDED